VTRSYKSNNDILDDFNERINSLERLAKRIDNRFTVRVPTLDYNNPPMDATDNEIRIDAATTKIYWYQDPHWITVGGGGSPAPPWDFSTTTNATYDTATPGTLLFYPVWGTPGDACSYEISQIGDNPYYHIPLEGVDTGSWRRERIIAFPYLTGDLTTWHEVTYTVQFNTWTLQGDVSYGYPVWVNASLQALGWDGSSWSDVEPVYVLATTENVPANPPLTTSPDPATSHTRHWRALFHSFGESSSMLGFFARFAFVTDSSVTIDLNPSVYFQIFIRKLSYPFPDPYLVTYPTS
jgi:hypothetical protein